MDQRFSHKSVLVIFSVALSMLLTAAGRVSANPVYYTPCGLDVVLLVLFNLPINLAVIELVSYAGMLSWQGRIFRSNAPEWMVSRIIQAALFVSILGGAIDLLFIYSENGPTSSDFGYWSFALALIFLSVVGAMYFFIKTRLWFACAVGAVDVVVNTAFWIAFAVYGADLVLYVWLVDIAAIVACIVLSIRIGVWFDMYESRVLKDEKADKAP